MKKGFTLVEVLLVLLFLPIILLLSSGVLKWMVNSESYEATQLEVFLLQYRYLIQTSVNVTYDENGISYGANNQEYTIILDKNRLVKTPGYEILLFEVERMEMHEGCLSIYSKKKWTCLEI